MACLKARTANTGAGVSGGSKLMVASEDERKKDKQRHRRQERKRWVRE